jgi:Na+-transporting NADH:ubiquinone oxidoreductase subunit C
MNKTIYFAIFLSVTAMLVTAIAYLGYNWTAPIIEENTIKKINDNIALLYNPEDGYTRNENQQDNKYRENDSAYKTVDSIYEVLDRDGELVVVIYDMAVQGRNDIIHALVAVNPYTDTVEAITYYDHAETPNIGEKYTREEESSKLIGQTIGNVTIDALAGATTTWTSLNTMFENLATHYDQEGVHVDE